MMVLVDTSVWIDHLRQGEQQLVRFLDAERVLMHPFVRGELACGSLANRDEVLYLLGNLPRVPLATDEEALLFIERHRLMGQGIGYIDIHLLASVVLSDEARLWTRDRRLATAAHELGLALPEPTP